MMSMRLIGFVMLCAAATTAQTAELRLRSSIVCQAPVVRLADVAEVRADDAVLGEALGVIALCPAPARGVQKILSNQQVRQLLTLSGVEAADIRLTGSDEVLLLTESEHLQSRGTAPRTVRQALFTAEAATDKRQKAPLAAGDPPVEPAAASTRPAPPLVERGASVTVHARRPGVQITAPGKALARGGLGDTISVELGDARERAVARVIGPQVVEIAESATKP